MWAKPQLARLILMRALDAGVTVAWMIGDSVYSSTPLRRELEHRKQPYMLAVTSAFPVRYFDEEGFQQERIISVFKRLGHRAWKRLSAGAGSKGKQLSDWVWRRWNALGEGSPQWQARAEAEGFDTWLLARRSLGCSLGYHLLRRVRPA